MNIAIPLLPYSMPSRRGQVQRHPSNILIRKNKTNRHIYTFSRGRFKMLKSLRFKLVHWKSCFTSDTNMTSMCQVLYMTNCKTSFTVLHDVYYIFRVIRYFFNNRIISHPSEENQWPITHRSTPIKQAHTSIKRNTPERFKLCTIQKKGLSLKTFRLIIFG